MNNITDKKIQQAFDNWDNAPNDISYNKQAVWASTQKKNIVFIPLFFKAAAAVIILLLSGALAYSIYWNRQQNNYYQQQLAVLQQQLKQKPKKVIEKQTAYKTKIKKVFAASPEQKKKIADLKKQLHRLQEQNAQLENNLQYITQRSNTLKDSVKYWNTTAKRLQIYYRQEIADLKKQYEPDLTFNIDPKALMALKEDKTTVLPQIKRKPKGFFRFKLRNENVSPNSSKPERRRRSFIKL